jgi:hypothetical protein
MQNPLLCSRYVIDDDLYYIRKMTSKNIISFLTVEIYQQDERCMFRYLFKNTLNLSFLSKIVLSFETRY